MSPVQGVTLVLRSIMEAGVVNGLAYWGVHTASGTVGKVLLGVAAPTVGFGVWGTLDFRFAGRYAEPLRLVEELAISGAAAAALYVAGLPVPGAALATLSASYHALLYATGDRLLR